MKTFQWLPFSAFNHTQGNFKCTVLAVKIQFQLDQNKRQELIDQLTALLPDTEDEIQSAAVHYELKILDEELGNSRQAKKHHQAAVKLYQYLYQKNHLFLYKQRIKKLTP